MLGGMDPTAPARDLRQAVGVIFIRRSLLAAVLIAPAAALAVLAFESGGYYPGTTAIAALVTLAALAVWVLLAANALAGLGRPAAVMTVLLAAFAGWTLLSGTWSHAPGRALIEFDRALLYLAVFALFALVGRMAARVRALVASLAVAALVVAVAALISYLLPDLLPVSSAFARRRLSYPTGYWNTTGLIAGLGVIWSLHLASGVGEQSRVRVAATAAIAPLVAVLAYTASRGAVAATLAGVAAYVLVTRSREVAVGLIACGAAGLVTLVIVSHTPDLSAFAPLPPAAITQGRRAALALVLCAGGAAALRGWLIVLERRIAGVEVSVPSRLVLVRAAIGGVALVLAVGIAVGLPARVSHAYGQFTGARADALSGQAHLTSFSSDGRTELWHTALKHGFAADPLRGSGAGTFAVLWERYRREPTDELVAASLYAGTLGDLGLVGAGLLFAALIAIAIALARRGGRRRCLDGERAAWAGLFAGAAAWLVFAAVDWNWQMPACTIWLFAAGGLAVSPAVDGRAQEPERGRFRLVAQWAARVARAAGGAAIAAGAVALALVPLALARSSGSLDSAIVDLQRGDCAGAQTQASASRDAVSQRSEPYMVLAYCAARGGRSASSLSYAAHAVALDPSNWEVHYAQGLVEAAAGREPRAALRAALVLNPLGSYAIEAAAELDHGSAATRRRVALRLPIPLAEDVCGGPTQEDQVAPCGDPKLPALGNAPAVATRRP